MTTYSADSEAIVVGAALTRPDILPLDVGPSDFYTPTLSSAWAVIEEAHRHGQAVDPTLVAQQIEADHPGAARVLAAAIAAVPSISTAGAHAAIVVAAADARRLDGALLDARTAIGEGRPAPEVADTLLPALTRASHPRLTVPEDLWNADQLRNGEWPEPPAVIPGLLNQGDRLLLVGGEGSGKSVLIRHILGRAAAGLHPFTNQQIEPAVSLVVDCENPGHVIRGDLRRLHPASPNPNLWVALRPGGIDIRSRHGRADLESLIAHVRPAIVGIGPLYKVYRRAGSNESDEDAATAAQNVLDDLRTRYDFALVIEHHAPKANGANQRRMSPFGSSAWLRWPELGWGLIPHDTTTGRDCEPDQANSQRVKPFRGDRGEAERPTRLDRSGPGSSWPVTAYWADGMPRTPPADF